MPKKGYKSITVKDELYNKVKEEAEKQEKSISKLTEEIITKEVKSS